MEIKQGHQEAYILMEKLNQQTNNHNRVKKKESVYISESFIKSFYKLFIFVAHLIQNLGQTLYKN